MKDLDLSQLVEKAKEINDATFIAFKEVIAIFRRMDGEVKDLARRVKILEDSRNF